MNVVCFGQKHSCFLLQSLYLCRSHWSNNWSQGTHPLHRPVGFLLHSWHGDNCVEDAILFHWVLDVAIDQQGVGFRMNVLLGSGRQIKKELSSPPPKIVLMSDFNIHNIYIYIYTYIYIYRYIYMERSSAGCFLCRNRWPDGQVLLQRFGSWTKAAVPLSWTKHGMETVTRLNNLVKRMANRGFEGV